MSAITEDLDETRRLLYMGMCVSETEEYELAGTLMNALLHHEGAEPGLTLEAARTHVVALFAGEGTARKWAADSVERISLQLRTIADDEAAVAAGSLLSEHLSGPIAE